MSYPRIGKGEIAARMSKRLGISAASAAIYLAESLGEIRKALADGESVTIQGFGSWKLRNQPAREGKIGSGEDTLSYATQAKTVCKFKIAPELALEVATGNREGA